MQYSLCIVINTHKRSKMEGLLSVSSTSQPLANCSNHQLLRDWYSGPATTPPASDAGYNLPFSHHCGACFSSHYSKLSRQRESWLM